MKRRWLRKLFTVVVLTAVLAVGVAWLVLRASLPWLDGEFAVPGLQAQVRIQRDAQGYTTITGQDRIDIARATGYVHAQDRFFQMDLLRRSSAGELAELFGSRALAFDQQRRRHRMRSRAQRMLNNASDEQKALLKAYTEGVNQGLNALRAPPFEYLLLRQQGPHAWREEDSLLAVLAMYFNLQAGNAVSDAQYAWLADCLPPEMLAFLLPQSTEWDAALAGDIPPEPAMPSAQQFDARQLVALPGSEHRPLALNEGAKLAALTPMSMHETMNEAMLLAMPWETPELLAQNRAMVGSNNWAVDGTLTEHGAALVADDMHLGLRLPHVWYRLRLQQTEAGSGPNSQNLSLDISGVSLPGMPFIVAGSNRHIAWGFTNSYGDFLDLVSLELDPQDPQRYRTPEGFQNLEQHTELIQVSGGEAVSLQAQESRWGPVIDTDHRGRPRVWRWIGHDNAALNLAGFQQLEQTRTVAQALDVAHVTGMPAQNLVVGDRHGDIAWTIIGRIPQRSGFDGRKPQDWTQPNIQWQGLLPPEQVPQVVNPARHRLWTANGRVASGEGLQRLGDGGYALGARAAQIRDRLMALPSADEADMMAIHLDDEARFLTRWRRLLLDILDAKALGTKTLGTKTIANASERAALRDAVLQWSGRAAADDAGYRLVREFRDGLRQRLMQGLTAHCPAPNDQSFRGNPQAESPLWRLVNQQPSHLLPKEYPEWRDLFLQTVDELAQKALADSGDIEQYTWGARNQLQMSHPLAAALPFVGRWLSMPVQPLSGDRDMPRVQGRRFGASQRMAVSPGHEESGYLQVPGGQSGHPLSPYFGAGHSDWVEGRPTPFLPGPAEHELTLVPAR
jgi:penicillin amidase